MGSPPPSRRGRPRRRPAGPGALAASGPGGDGAVPAGTASPRGCRGRSSPARAAPARRTATAPSRRGRFGLEVDLAPLGVALAAQAIEVVGDDAGDLADEPARLLLLARSSARSSGRPGGRPSAPARAARDSRCRPGSPRPGRGLAARDASTGTRCRASSTATLSWRSGAGWPATRSSRRSVPRAARRAPPRRRAAAPPRARAGRAEQQRRGEQRAAARGAHRHALAPQVRERRDPGPGEDVDLLGVERAHDPQPLGAAPQLGVAPKGGEEVERVGGHDAEPASGRKASASMFADPPCDKTTFRATPKCCARSAMSWPMRVSVLPGLPVMMAPASAARAGPVAWRRRSARPPPRTARIPGVTVASLIRLGPARSVHHRCPMPAELDHRSWRLLAHFAELAKHKSSNGRAFSFGEAGTGLVDVMDLHQHEEVGPAAGPCERDGMDQGAAVRHAHRLAQGTNRQKG